MYKTSNIKYKKLYDLILNKIKSGVYASGSKLPSENELMNTENVSRQTVRNALQLLKDDGYISSVHGRGYFVNTITQPKTKRIAHVSIRISDYVFPRVLRGIEEVITANDYSMSLYSTGNSFWIERQIITRLLSEPLDGVIVSGTKSALPNPNLHLYEQLADRGIPLVFVNSDYPQLNKKSIVHVVMDDYAGGHQLGDLLFSKGVKDVGGIFKSDDIQSFRRYNGFIGSCIDNGIPFNDMNFIWFSSEDVKNYMNLSAVFEHLKSCEALICYNDEVVRSILPEAERFPWTRLKYIYSFDNVYSLNTPIAQCLSLGHLGAEIGRIAANKMLNMIAGKQEESVELPWVIPDNIYK